MVKYIDTGCIASCPRRPSPSRTGAFALAAMSASAEQSITHLGADELPAALALDDDARDRAVLDHRFGDEGLEQDLHARIPTHRRVSSIFIISGSVGEAIFTPPVLVIAM